MPERQRTAGAIPRGRRRLVAGRCRSWAAFEIFVIEENQPRWLGVPEWRARHALQWLAAGIHQHGRARVAGSRPPREARRAHGAGGPGRRTAYTYFNLEDP
jgi:hypothetical protein